jgi:single-strand DNA-binding protein
MNINAVILEGNLTRDPELSATGDGTSICKLRIAVNARRKDQSGNWVDDPNFFDITVWGDEGERCANHLSKGRAVLIHGRLDWHEWDAPDGSGKRQAVEVVAHRVRFLGKGGGGSAPLPSVDQSDYEAAQQARDEEEDIPF